jgi:hypothetical protein
MMHNPRRQAGESLRELREERVVWPLVQWLGGAMGATLVAMIAWLDYLLGNGGPWYASGAALAMTGVAIVGARRAVREARAYNRGIRGEQTVADALSGLAAHGYQTFHDLPDTTRDGKACNIDHVLVGPEGVFVIETKFRGKDSASRKRITVTPEALLVDGRPVQPDPREQARACADSVRRRLGARVGAELHVRPVVIMPSWYTENGFGGAAPSDGCWVLNENALANTLKKARHERLAGPSLNQVVAELDAWSRQREP